MRWRRRAHSDSFTSGLAAEVLELRSLLSSAAAAVGHALHAANQHHAVHAASAPPFSYNGPIAGTLNVSAFDFSNDFSGNLVVSKTTLQAGAAFKVKLNIPPVGAVAGYNIGAITGSLAGSITSVVSQGSNEIITISPKTGSLTASVSYSGIAIKPKLTPAHAPMTLTIDSQGHIVSFSGFWNVPALQPFYAGGITAFSFTTT